MPDIGNYLFGGSSSDQAISLGGVTPDGRDAVNDMTYIFLKVTEMLSIRDPNVNARYHPKKNSEAYLKRLCEVNINTTATPSIHNDEAVMESLKEFRYPAHHLRDWSATGCVEPTLSGRHMGHTNCMMFNMVAALEMALYNGRHPLMRWDVGPKTGNPVEGAPSTGLPVFGPTSHLMRGWRPLYRAISSAATMLNIMQLVCPMCLPERVGSTQPVADQSLR